MRRGRDKARLRAVSGVLLCLCACAQAMAQAMFRPIAPLPNATTGSTAGAVSADGRYVIGISSSADGNQAYRWENGVTTPLGFLPGGNYSEPFDISNDGSVIVGGGTTTLGFEAFRWTSAGMVGLGDLPGGAFSSRAGGVSPGGAYIVGEASGPNGYEATLWFNNTLQSLGYLTNIGERRSFARDVSSNGAVIVGASTSANTAPGKYEAFRYEAGVMTGLGDLPGGGFDSTAFGISADGRCIVGYSESSGGQEPAIWRDGVIQGLGFLPGGNEGSAYRASADGTVIVGWNKTIPTFDPFIYDPVNGMQNLEVVLRNIYGLSLDLAGWDLRYGLGVTADGRGIVGWGINPQGLTQGWLVNLPPLPTITGTIALESYLPAATGMPITMELQRQSSGAAAETLVLDLNAAGQFSFSTRGMGTFDVYVKASNWLRKRIGTIFIASSNITIPPATLTNGDVDGDNEVTLSDYSLLAQAFGTVPGDSTWDPRADLDGDSEVTLADYNILSMAFGKAGD